MSDIRITINNMSQPIPIKYTKSIYGFNYPNNDDGIKYLFELIINEQSIGKKYFRNLEKTKYSHLINLEHQIKIYNIKSYKASLTILSNEQSEIYELEGIINNKESCSTQQGNNIYIEFTKNNVGIALCTCFYIGQNQNTIFASPPN